MFYDNIFKRFHDDEEDAFTKFSHLWQTDLVRECTHEWEVSTIRVPNLADEKMLKKYIAVLSPILGITKDIMSWGPHVLDMEYREPDC